MAVTRCLPTFNKVQQTPGSCIVMEDLHLFMVSNG
uniref:Uncharacterized protein n=1 Tax=Anguilla anguilla TaxID=7936 RepID=A0A0E9TG58_ANGAN